MKMTMMLRRVSTPATPMMKSIAAITRNLRDQDASRLQGQGNHERPMSLAGKISALAQREIHRFSSGPPIQRLSPLRDRHRPAAFPVQGARQDYRANIATSKTSRNSNGSEAYGTDYFPTAPVWFPSGLSPVLRRVVPAPLSLPAAACFNLTSVSL